MNDNSGPSLDLSAASSAAMEQLGANDITASPSQSTPPPPTSGQSAPPADPTVEIEFAPGKKEAVTLQQLKEWRESGLRQQDYTRKTQEVAEMRRQSEQVYRAYQQMEQERAQLQEFFQDEENVLKLVAQQYGPQAMQKLMGMLSGQQQQAQQYDPNAPATLEQANRIAQQQAHQVRQELAKLQQQVGNNVAQELQNLRQEQETQEYKKVLNPVVSKIFEENPILSAVDGMEEVIRFKVYQSKPQSVEQAIELFNTIGKEQAEKLSAKFTEINKQSIANKQKLIANGIEPAGGAPPSAEPKRFKKSNGDIDWKGISAQAETYMKTRGGF